MSTHSQEKRDRKKWRRTLQLYFEGHSFEGSVRTEKQQDQPNLNIKMAVGTLTGRIQSHRIQTYRPLALLLPNVEKKDHHNSTNEAPSDVNKTIDGR